MDSGEILRGEILERRRDDHSRVVHDDVDATERT